MISGSLRRINDEKNKHCEPTKEQLLNLRKCNFDESHCNVLWNKVPPLLLEDLKVQMFSDVNVAKLTTNLDD